MRRLFFPCHPFTVEPVNLVRGLISLVAPVRRMRTSDSGCVRTGCPVEQNQGPFMVEVSNMRRGTQAGLKMRSMRNLTGTAVAGLLVFWVIVAAAAPAFAAALKADPDVLAEKQPTIKRTLRF